MGRISLVLADWSPDIICLQEIWNIPNKDFVKLPGYHPLIFTCRVKSQGGGVGIFVKQEIKFKTVPSIFIGKFLESIAIEISHNNKKFVVSSIYRSNRSLFNLFLNPLVFPKIQPPVSIILLPIVPSLFLKPVSLHIRSLIIVRDFSEQKMHNIK